MIIFPAIDIKNGNCVRLIKGNFDKVTIFNNSPVDQALFFKEKGFTHLHLVDLDGALNDSTINQKIIKKIIKNTKQKIQLGGGIKKIDQISKWLDVGVDKVVLGTMAVKDEKNFEKACIKFQSKIVVAVDVLNDFLYFQGWKNKSKIKVLNSEMSKGTTIQVTFKKA
jgi:phosphoribosylformimino-5-aminoimidazole carboxamide ribotide isomerase